jgi:hypothetical protein
VIDSWRQLLPGFDATQHLTGPIVATTADAGACCGTTVRGHHTLIRQGRTSVWMVAGRYRVSLVRVDGVWRISGITLKVSYEQGDRELVERAQERVAPGRGGRTSV